MPSSPRRLWSFGAFASLLCSLLVGLLIGAAQAQSGAANAAVAPMAMPGEKFDLPPARLVPTLADFLPRAGPALAAAASACSGDALRTAPELGAIDESSQPLLGLLRSWGRRNLRFVDAPEGCISWAAVVRAWQATTGAPVNGVLTATDLNRLNDERMTHFATYRAALAAWQKERADAAMAPAPLRPEPPPAGLLAPRVADSLADLGDLRDKVAALSETSLGIDCMATEGEAGDRLCKAAIETGRLKGWMLAEANYWVAWHYYKRADQPRALGHLTAALEAVPAMARALVLRASVYTEMREHARALVDVDTAIGLVQKDPKQLSKAFAVRAVVVGRSGNLRAARDDNEEALRLDPDNKHALGNRRVYLSR